MKTDYRLHNGVLMPSIGLGTWLTWEGDTAQNAVVEALNAGYRHIDTAAFYRNEVGVGEGVRRSGIDRSDVFVTSKVWNTERGYDKALRSFDRSLADLGIEYIDLFLIHWPAAPHLVENWRETNASTWRALEQVYREGRVRAIGVSNFMPHHLQPLIDDAEIMPMVNQIEYHPGYRQQECVDFCHNLGIVVEAYSPLGTGAMLTNETLTAIASAYGKSVAQICIRWALQNGVAPLPKSISPQRLAENLDVFDFKISDAHMEIINNMAYCGGSGVTPDTIDL